MTLSARVSAGGGRWAVKWRGGGGAAAQSGVLRRMPVRRLRPARPTGRPRAVCSRAGLRKTTSLCAACPRAARGGGMRRRPRWPPFYCPCRRSRARRPPPWRALIGRKRSLSGAMTPRRDAPSRAEAWVAVRPPPLDALVPPQWVGGRGMSGEGRAPHAGGTGGGGASPRGWRSGRRRRKRQCGGGGAGG